MDRTPSQPIELFYCYAEKDRALLNKLDQHLIGLRSAHLITLWHEGTISPGMSKKQEIETHLRHASVILLLISADFLQSDYYSSQALAQAIERHRAGNAYVVPILLRPVDYSGTPFAELPMLPSDGRPVTLWSNRDAALEDIARSIRNIVLTLLAQQHVPSALREMTQQGMEWSTIPAPSSLSQQRRVRQQNPHIGTQFNIQDLHIHAASISKTEQREMKQRAILLNRVEQKWIKGLLQQSFYEKVQIDLELQEHPQMVSNPWQEIVQELAPSTGPLPSGMPIQEIYDHFSGELLILGRSGAGKTILLLELLRVLLERARNDETHSIPVVFYLSSWAQRRQPLEQWLIEELRSKYKIPLELATRWIKDKKDQVILPLLDGLDEVVQPARVACVNAINTYRSHYGLTSLVVCCRQEEYGHVIAQTHQKLDLSAAVLIQPLTLQQINTSLGKADPSLASLNAAIQHNPTLQELADTPLMVSVLAEVYEDIPLQHIQLPQIQQIFELYVKKMLKRRGKIIHYTTEQFKHWLACLAKQMQRRGQSEFYLEQLQKDWLASDKLYRLILGGGFGIIIGLLVWLAYTITFAVSPEVDLSWSAIIGVKYVIVFVVLYGFAFNALAIPTNAASTMHTKQVSIVIRRNVNRLLQNAIVYGLLLGLIHFFLINGGIVLSLAILHSFFFGIGYAIIGRIDGAIHPVEAIAWSWNVIRTNLPKFLGIGLLFGFVFSLAVGPVWILIANGFQGENVFAYLLDPKQVFYLLIIGIAIGLLLTLIFAWMSGISHAHLDKNERLMPNQGIYISARNSLILGLSSGVLVGTIAALLFGPGATWLQTVVPNSYPTIPVLEGICWGIGCGITVFGLVALRNGGVVCIQHYLLRFLLYRANTLPWSTIRMLDDAVNHKLLYNVGGGYRFIHELFLNYFASQLPPKEQADIQLAPLDFQPTIPQRSQFPSIVKVEWFAIPAVLAILVFAGIMSASGAKTYSDQVTAAQRLATAAAAHAYPSYLPGHGTFYSYASMNIVDKQWDDVVYSKNFCHFMADGYHVNMSNADQHALCLNHTSLSNFAFVVNMVIINGDCGGILFHHTVNQISTNYYGLSVCSDSGYIFFKKFLGDLHTRPSVLWDPYHSDAFHIRLGQSNTVAIVVQQNQFTLFFNRQRIARFSDNDMTIGAIGLTAVTLGKNNSTEVVYTEAQVWTL